MSQPITVAHLVYYFHPEMGYDINYLARYVYPGTKMVIITSDRLDLWNTTPEAMQQKDAAFCEKYGVELIRLPSFKTGKKKAGVFMKGINACIAKVNPEIVFYHGLETIGFGLSLLKQTGKRYVTGDTHTLFSQFEHMTIPGKIYMDGFFKPLVVKRMVKRNVPVFYTARENKKVLEWFGFKSDRIFNNEICTDTEVFKKVEVDPQTLIRGIQAGGKTVIYTGKSDHFKQPHLIVDAIKKIENQIQFPLNIVYIGAVNEPYNTEHYAQGFSNPLIQIFQLGPKPNGELYKYYSMADVAVFPKQNSLSSLDVQACKLPVIMENDETNQHRLAKGGLLYEPDNLQDLADKLLQILTNEKLHQKLAEEGYAYVQEHFNYGQNLLKMQAIFVEDFLNRKS